MDEKAHSLSHFYSQPQSPKIYLPKPASSASSGLTLVIPSLKSLKASQSANKPTASAAAAQHHHHHHRSASILAASPAVFQDVDVQEKKIPRPVKLKPLKEVLSKLMFQLKKKDDYAFFLHPVDVANVPGYSDVVKRPMDLGTMSDKVAKGKYRSLEEFASDFRLVTNNAKLFNPPGTIYHTEADRLEVWGLDHISKAAATVIQYETDWNIEIEKDDDGATLNVDEEDEENADSTAMEVDGAPPPTTAALRERSVSVASQPQMMPQGPSRRGPRGPYKKHGQNGQSTTLSETLEQDGGLPGSKDGLGSFPAGSDWAKTMVALKLKGKRYKTKKERLRIEREGPPLLPDGSLDYTEMEDPFSVLSFFVPDPPSRPHVVPLYPPLYNPPPPTQSVSDPSSSNTPQPPAGISTPHPPSTFPSATSLPLDHPPLQLPLAFLQQQQKVPLHPHHHQQQQQTDGSGKQPQAPQRRHWTIVRNATARQKGKEREDEQETADVPAWRMPREPHAVDYGSFSVLAGALAEEMGRRQGMGLGLGIGVNMSSSSSSSVGNVVPPSGVGTPVLLNERTDEETTGELIRASLDCEKAARRMGADEAGAGAGTTVNGTNLMTSGYWTSKRAAEGEEYVRDLVYGGVDGLAYVRSLAEFVDGDIYCENQDSKEADAPDHEHPYNPYLGMKLAKWVETNVVDVLTEGRHSLLRETAQELARQQRSSAPQHPALDPRQGTVASQVAASLHLYPAALVAMSSLLHIRMHKIDMGALIKTPNELFLSEEEWVGKAMKERRRRARADADAAVLSSSASSSSTASAVPAEDAMEVEEPEQTWAGVDASLVKEKVNGTSPAYEQEGPEELSEVLEYVANVIVDLDRRTRLEKTGKKSSSSSSAAAAATTAQPEPDDSEGMKVEDGDGSEPRLPPPPPPPPSPAEDPMIRNLRLNLLALAKRAPLDTIARLPKDLVPEHIRHFVPTLGSTG